jgi:hypothetical protein
MRASARQWVALGSLWATCVASAVATTWAVRPRVAPAPPAVRSDAEEKMGREVERIGKAVAAQEEVLASTVQSVDAMRTALGDVRGRVKKTEEGVRDVSGGLIKLAELALSPADTAKRTVSDSGARELLTIDPMDRSRVLGIIKAFRSATTPAQIAGLAYYEADLVRRYDLLQFADPALVRKASGLEDALRPSK